MSIKAPTGFTYMVHPAVQDNAEEGLAAADNIWVTDFIGTATMNPTYSFHIKEGSEAFVLIVNEGDPAPLCKCKTKTPTCKHAFWLMDQIFYTASCVLSEKCFPRTIHFAENGEATWPFEMHMELPSAADLINKLGTQRFKEFRGWNFRLQYSPDNYGTGQITHQDREHIEDRFKLLFWLLAPNDIIREQFNASVKRRSDDDDGVLEPALEGFEELVRSFMVENGQFRTRLDAVLTPDFTTSTQLVQVYFEYKKTVQELVALRNPLYEHDRLASFNRCVERLREHDNDIARLYDGGCVRRPEHIWYMAGLLLNILSRVVGFNYPAITDTGCVEDVDDPENNLYFRFIVAPPVGEQRLFVLGTLQRIQARILVSHKDTMAQIWAQLQPATANERFISTFANKLQEVDAVVRE